MNRAYLIMTVLALGLVASCASNRNTSSPSYVYAKIFTNTQAPQPDSLAIDPRVFVHEIDTTRKLISFSHTYFPGSFCAADDDYACFHSEYAGVHFSIPRTLDMARPHWSHSGVEYSVRTGLRSLTIIGQRIEAMEIVGIKGSVTTHYLFSESLGLIAFGELSAENHGYGAMYWLEGKQGFGWNQVSFVGEFDWRPESLKQKPVPLDEIKRAIAAGESLETKDASGQTPILRAAALEQWNLVTLLLEAGADRDVINNWGKSLDYYFQTSARDSNVTNVDSLHMALRTYCRLEHEAPQVCLSQD